MDIIPLIAQARTHDKAKDVRQKGSVPCVIYGNATENQSLECDALAISQAYKQAGANTLVELDTGSKKIPVLFHEVSLHPVTDRIDHVDFYAVNMKQDVEAEVPIILTGESLAVKEQSAILVTTLNHVTVKCLPTNLPHELSVSLDSLKEYGDSVTVSEIIVPEGVEILDEDSAVIALVQEKRQEEVEKTATAEGEEGEKTEEGAADTGDADKGEEKSDASKNEK